MAYFTVLKRMKIRSLIIILEYLINIQTTSIMVIITAGRQRLTGHKKGSKNLYIASLAEGVHIGCV